MILTGFGAAGDIVPLIAVAKALAQRGHAPRLLLEARFLSMAGRANAEAFALDDSAAPGTARQTAGAHRAGDGALSHPLSGTLAYLRRVVIPALPAASAALNRHITEWAPDLLIAHHNALTVPPIAARHRIPWAMIAVAPASWTSREQNTLYPGMPDKDTYSPTLMNLGIAAGQRVTNLLVDGPLNRVRRRLGFERVTGALFTEMFSGGLNLGLWSPRFRPVAGDDAPRSHICGFPRPGAWAVPVPGNGAGPATTAALERFLDSGAPPIVATMGTSVPRHHERFFNAALEASRAVGRRVILLTGPATVRVPRAPDVLSIAFAPLEPLLTKAAGAIIHAGLGTIAACLRSGCPMVAVPFLHDQFDNAARARRLGVSVTLASRRLEGRWLAPLLNRQTKDPGVRQTCAELAPQIAREDGAEHAALLLESLVVGSIPPAHARSPR